MRAYLQCFVLSGTKRRLRPPYIYPVIGTAPSRRSSGVGGYLAGTPTGAKESLRTAYVPVLLVKVALANVLLGLATGGPPSVGSLL